ncbi:regulatory LuxR family protein [Streptomyces sp. 3211.6]|uniref:ATP-binding protein n=1 Tax=Streptomyces sp. 3211.6 TaxID=1938845 RepID=UPI000F24B1A5|nr:LuxR family transcriptional regulator [Streptomyces sp. 3211.6]RKS96947.1 regulatory LuxR family protein [Streptomyces sp. 3211.6]
MKTTEQQTERLAEHRAGTRAELRVERRAQLRALQEAFEGTAAGEGRVAVVTGPVGCGKTDVLHALCRHAARAGALVLTATGVRAERHLGFGVLDRLLDDPQLPPATAGHVRALLATAEREGAAPAGRPAAPAAGAGRGEQPMAPARARELRDLCGVLREAARHRPLVVAVDDLQHADRPSVAALMYLHRRLRTSRVLMVLTDGGADAPDGTGPRAELAGDPDCRTVRVAPLTRRGVAELLAARLDPCTADRLAAECHALTGGNPLLVHAFADDRLAAGDHDGETPVGGSFAAALRTCLLRCDEGAADAARALAVLGDLAPASLVARMLGTGVEAAARDLAALTEAGLLDEGRFRHPAAHAAVLAGCEDADRRDRHLRAARLLHEDGAPGAAVARQLVAARQAPGPWAVTVLREAAEGEAAADRDRFAADCLELAVRACQDPGERAALTALLVRNRWRTSPSVAARHLGALEAHARDGLLSARDGATLALARLWLGRSADAPPRPAPGPQGTGFADAGRHHADVTRARRLLYWDADADADAAHADADAGPGGPETSAEAATADAELTLQSTRIGETALESAMAALYALLYADRTGQAAHWCDTLVAEATARRETTWRAVLTGIRAEIAVRQGALADAERHARTALAVLPPEDWGVAIGIPLAARLVACTVTGRTEDAQRVLAQRVPQEMFGTRFGGQYLYARGRHYLAVGRLRAALEDFRRCGELMAERGVDRPALIAWRGGAATACLGLGLRERAGEFIGEQMELSAPEHIRVRGSSLRTIAALGEARRRPALLWEAITLLQEAGDRLELVGALADLSCAHHELGDYNRARMMAGRAVKLAQDCDAPSLCERLLPHPAVLDPAPPADTGPAEARADAIATLSDAERRVAALAAVGHSNREIGRELFITVSTVEQHLTRVYRKLRISRRADLPAELPLGLPGAA